MDAAGPLAARDGLCRLRDFRFRSGRTLAELRLRYRSLGDPAAPAVLLLHGTGTSADSLLAPDFGGELFGPGQPLDARRHFLILPDAIGHGGSSKPSDGLRTDFPAYDCDDLAAAQVRLLTEHFGLRRLHLVLGYSLGGMQAWLIAARHPDLAEFVVPLACVPGPMAGRNRMLRRMLTESIRRDPDWQGGNYREQPRGAHRALLFYALASNGGEAALAAAAPTPALADAWVDARLATPLAADANDLLYQWEATRDYDPSPLLDRIRASVLAINSADDERNPPELGVLDQAIARVPNGRALLIPTGPGTCGHATLLKARLWAGELAEFLAGAAPRGR